MKRSRPVMSALVLMAVMVLALPALALASEPIPGPFWAAEFDSSDLGDLHTTYFDPVLGRTNFADGHSPQRGQTTFSGGYVSMAPLAYRGGTIMYGDSPVITRLPATVKFRARFPRYGYRSVSINLYSGSPYDAAGKPTNVWERLDFHLGMTHHNYVWPMWLSVDGVGIATKQPSPLVPNDQWVEGEIRLYEDRAVGVFNGQAVTVQGNVASVMSRGGLHLGAITWDDYLQGGAQYDYFRVEQAPETNVAPAARIEAPSEVFKNTDVTFDGSASTDSDGSIASYAWDFGDGTSATGLALSHSYVRPGVYAVTLTTTDDDGATATATTTITVSSRPPVAAIFAKAEQFTDLGVFFDGSASSDPDGSIVSYAWDFGDGTTGTGATPTHAYAEPGDHTVTLTVTDDDGVTASTSAPVSVIAADIGIDRLIREVQASPLVPGQKQKLLVELQAAKSAFLDGRWADALRQMEQFVDKIGAPNKHVSDQLKVDWNARSEAITASISAGMR